MTLAKALDKCPYCKEPIVSGASRCKHCHAELGDPNRKESLWARYDRFRTGFLFGVLFALIVFVLAYLHFTSAN